MAWHLGSPEDQDWQEVLNRAQTTKYEALSVRAFSLVKDKQKSVRSAALQAEKDKYEMHNLEASKWVHPRLLKFIEKTIAEGIAARPVAKGTGKLGQGSRGASPSCNQVSPVPLANSAFGDTVKGGGNGKKGGGQGGKKGHKAPP